MANLEKLFTVDEVAQMLMVTSRTVRNYLRDGTLKGQKIGGQWRFTQADVQAMFETETVHKKLQEDGDRDIADFLRGKPGKAGTAQVCAVADVFGPQAQVLEICGKLCDLFNAENDNRCSFRFAYDEAQQKGRFVLFAPPAFIGKAMSVLQ